MYHTVGYSRIVLFQLFRGKFFTNCHKLFRISTENRHFEGKIFTNQARFVKFAKNFSHENNLLYGILVILWSMSVTLAMNL